MNIKNLSQFKKAMKEGHLFKIVKHYIHPEYNGQIRYVNIMQENSMYTGVYNDPDNYASKANNGKGIYFKFCKAANWEFADGLCKLFTNDKSLILVIEVLDDVKISKPVNEKLLEYAKEMVKDSNRYFEFNGNYYVYNDYILIRLDFPIGVEVNKNTPESLKKYIEDFFSNNDYVLCNNMPSVNEIKNAIKRLVGRKKTCVCFNGKGDLPSINVRYLLKALETLKAENIYMSENSFRRNPIKIYENDDLQSTNVVMIFPVINNNIGEERFFIVE